MHVTFKRFRMLFILPVITVLIACDARTDDTRVAPIASSVSGRGVQKTALLTTSRAAITVVKPSQKDIGEVEAVDGPGTVIGFPNGDSIEYYGVKRAVGPTQALVQTAENSYWIYYDLLGLPSRVLDVKTGAYLVVRLRTDALGAEYLSFDAQNRFLEGKALFKDPSRWFLAPVLGEMALLKFAISAGPIPEKQTPKLNGVLTLQAAQLAYGASVVMPSSAQTLLNGEDFQVLLDTSLLRALDRVVGSVVPYAQAQTAAALDRSALNGAMNLALIGAAAFSFKSSASALLAAASVASTYRKAAGLDNLKLQKNHIALDSILERAISGSYAEREAERVGLIERTRNAAALVLSKGIASIANVNPRDLMQTAQMLQGRPMNVRLDDPTLAIYVLPKKPLKDTSLIGSVVDSDGRKFDATGNVSREGDFYVVAKGPSGESLTMMGKIDQNKIVSGSVERSVKVSDN